VTVLEWLRENRPDGQCLEHQDGSLKWSCFEDAQNRTCRVTVSGYSVHVEINALPWSSTVIASRTVLLPAPWNEIEGALRWGLEMM
jgi:hypothetical protein